MISHSLASLITAGIAGQLADLDTRIASANSPGNLDGLFAHHVLRATASVSFTWEVSPFSSHWLRRNPGPVTNAPQLAVIGYGLTYFGHQADTVAQLTAGMRELMRRDPDPPDGVTFLRDPRQLLGIALAATIVRNEFPEFAGWLQGTLASARPGTGEQRNDLIRRHAAGLLADETPVTVSITGTDVIGLALLHWMIAEGTARLPEAADLKVLQKQIITGLMNTRPADLSIPDAALIRAAAGHIIESTIDSAILNRSHVGVVLRRFTPAMKRWRWDNPAKVQNPIRWPITSEREVQDITWTLLRAVFDDLVDEEPLRKVGHSSHRSDFGLPRLGVLVEVKYVRTAAEFRKIEREIHEDTVTYLRDRTTYKKLVVFIYDASASVQEHATTISALLEHDDIIDIVIASRPSQLPAPGDPDGDISQSPKPAHPRSPRPRRPRSSAAQTAGATRESQDGPAQNPARAHGID